MRFFKSNITASSATKILAAILLSSSLVACSSNDDEDPSLKVAELTDINEAFEVNVLWDASVGDGVGHYFSRIKPIVAYNKTISASRMGDVIAFDKATGEKLWQTDLSDINNERSFWDSRVSALVAGGPIAGMNKVFLGTETVKCLRLMLKPVN